MIVVIHIHPSNTIQIRPHWWKIFQKSQSNHIFWHSLGYIPKETNFTPAAEKEDPFLCNNKSATELTQHKKVRYLNKSKQKRKTITSLQQLRSEWRWIWELQEMITKGYSFYIKKSPNPSKSGNLKEIDNETTTFGTRQQELIGSHRNLWTMAPTCINGHH